MEKLEFFKNLGFNEYESKTLSSLIKLRQVSPKEISLDSNVPQNKLYSILRKFQNLGILAEIPNKKYELINFKTFINKRLNEEENKLKKLKQSLPNLENLNEKEEQFIFSLIKGQKAIMNKLAETNPKVKKEILGIQRNWKYWGQGIRAMKESIKSGVNVKLIGIINKETEPRAKQWKNIGCNIRKHNLKFGDYPLRFTIFDNKEARITIGKPEIKNPEDYITIWTSSKPLISILRKQFFETWKESKKF